MLEPDILESIYSRLKSRDKDDLIDVVKTIGDCVGDMGKNEKVLIADAVMSIFYLDDDEESKYAELHDTVVEVLSKMGSDIIEVLIGGMVGTEMHAEHHIAHTLGRMGQPAIEALVKLFRTADDPVVRGLALHALSHIDDPALIGILDEVIVILDHDSAELRDAATGAIGSMIECIGGLCLSPESYSKVFDKLIATLSDPHGGTRSKAVRSIGKLAKMNILNDEQKARLLPVITGILGIDDRHQWDRAFIVRREAEEAYFHLTGEKVSSVGALSICRKD
jgi:hypothetical protein